MLKKTQGIVIKQQKYTDDKRIIVVFTRESGLKSFIVRFSSSKKSFFNQFQPLFILDLEYTEKENQSMIWLKESSIHYPYKTIQNKPDKTSVVLFISEFLSKILENNFVDIHVFDFIKYSFLLYDNQEKNSNFHISFLISLSVYLGIMPTLDYSVENKFFNVRNACFSDKYEEYYCMNEVISKKYFDFYKINISESQNIKLIQNDRKQLLQKIIDFYAFHFKNIGKLNSLEVLSEMYSN